MVDLSSVRVVNEILASCVVQHEHECIPPDAGALLLGIDRAISELEINGQQMSDDGLRWLVCRRGNYKLMYRKPDVEVVRVISHHEVQNPGTRPLQVRMHVCTACGHLAFFQVPKNATVPKGWPAPISPQP
jgi:hypothetical protein